MTRLDLRQQLDVDRNQARLVLDQGVAHGAHQAVRRTGKPLQDQAHVRQAVIRQMLQRTGPAIENALQVVQH
ncbi:hypothetical protein D3C76_1636160 [compost metagenome]